MGMLLSEATQHDLERYFKESWPVLLLYGPQGSGKEQIVELIVTKFAEKASDQLHVGLESKSIGIDEIRAIKQYCKLKPADDTQVQMIIVHNAEKMTEEAQNAALKLLEEPKKHCMFVLVATSLQRLLPTVLSRCQEVQVTNPVLEQYVEYFSSPKIDVEKAYAMSGGRLRFMQETVMGDETKLSEVFKLAKRYYGATVYERLAMHDEILANDLGSFMFALQRITRFLLAKSTPKKVGDLTKSYKLLDKLSSSMTTNVNTKLLLDNLSVHL